MNSLEELSAKLAKEVSPDGWLCGPDAVEEYTRRLVAALGAQEPVAHVDHNSRDSFKWVNWLNALPDKTPLFAAPVLPSVPADVMIETSFTYKMETKEHSPTILITFPPNHWKTRDRLADELRAAAPSPQEDKK